MISTEFKIILKQDGNKWCATFEDFTNLMESPAGFGDLPIDAVIELFKSQKELNDNI